MIDAMEDFVLREAHPNDAAGIARVHVGSWRAAYRGIIPDQFLADLSQPDRKRRWARTLSVPDRRDFVYVAEHAAGDIVGFASGGLERAGDPIYRGELYAIYILPGHQRRGVGRALTGLVAERLIQLGLGSMLVWVLADNPWRRFYDTLGGQVLCSKQVETGGVELTEVSYGWLDTSALRSTSVASP